MGVRTIFSKVAFSLLLEEFTHLSLIIVVWNVQHFILNFDGKRLILSAKFLLSMSKMTAIAFLALRVLDEVLA